MKVQTSFRPLKKLSILTLGSILALSACSTTPSVTPYSDVSVPSDEVQTIERRFEAARAQQTDILAPKSYSKAIAKFNDAKKELSHQAKAHDVLEPLAESRAYLDKAEASADRTRQSAPELLAVRNDAMKSEAPALASDRWKKAENRLRNEMEDQESDSRSSISAEDRKEIQNLYILSQTQALKGKYLNKSKELVRVLDDQGAKKLVPTAYNDARSKIVEAEGTIEANRNDMTAVQAAAANAEKAAFNARDLFVRAKGVKEGSPEQAALAMAAQDQKNTALTQNLDRTSENLNAAQKDLSQTKENLTKTEENLTKTENERKMFKTQTEMQQYIASMQNRFDPNQAEVYQQGSNLLLRVKGMGFASGSSDIPAASTALLSQIQATVQEFPSSSVIVEGHTDSLGKTQKNQKLSQERAEAIKQYLVSNNAVTDDRISAKGYGSQKPITSNKTSAGRIQNRRVDIVIQNVANFDKGSNGMKTPSSDTNTNTNSSAQ